MVWTFVFIYVSNINRSKLIYSIVDEKDQLTQRMKTNDGENWGAKIKTNERKLKLISQTNRWTDTEQIISINSISHTNAWKLHNSYKYNKEGENLIYIDKC